MACDCLTDIEAKMTEHKVETLVFWGTGPDRNQLLAKPHIALVRRDTGNRERRSGRPASIAPVFCPFCGVRYSPEQAE